MREQRTPILTLFAPVFLFLWRQAKLGRVALDDFQLRAAVAARHDLTPLDVGRHQPHPYPVAHVQALLASDDLPFHRRPEDAHVRALRRRAGDQRLEDLPDPVV